MNTLWQVLDKKELPVKVVAYEPSLHREVLKLYRGGYPDSFDENDLGAIEFELDEIKRGNPHHYCFLAIRRKRVVGTLMFDRWVGPQDVYLLSYLYIKKSMQERGLGRILVAAVEEFLIDKARIIFTNCAGLLPDYDLSYPFFRAIGYKEWGEFPGYFRDDLSGIFLVKRNPRYSIGWGIPENSSWCPELARSRTGQRISPEEYQQEMRRLKPVAVSEWGLKALEK